VRCGCGADQLGIDAIEVSGDTVRKACLAEGDTDYLTQYRTLSSAYEIYRKPMLKGPFEALRKPPDNVCT
jgi:hypothetical protein